MKEASVARAMVAFPVVGLFIGACGAGAGLLAGWLFGEPLRAVAVVVAWMIITWGLHLDGLADSADALFSWRSREKKLEIMKDSRIGTMGSLALISGVLLKVVALYSLGPFWWVGALLAPMWGRWSDIYGIFFFPAAREGGMGRNFNEQVRKWDFVIASISALLIGGLLLPPWGGARRARGLSSGAPDGPLDGRRPRRADRGYLRRSFGGGGDLCTVDARRPRPPRGIVNTP